MDPICMDIDGCANIGDIVSTDAMGDMNSAEFKKLINCADLEAYSRLDPNEYEASLGRDYIRLKGEMPDWGYRLHVHGLHLPMEDMDIIFKYGLLSWYVEHFLGHYRTALRLRSYYDDVVSEKRRVRFYDLIEFLKFYAELEPRLQRPLSQEIEFLKPFKNYQLLLKGSGWKHRSFHLYLENEKRMEMYLEFIQNLIEAIEQSNDYDVLSEVHQTHQKITDTETIREMIYSDDLKRLGIIFQRWKIVVEKISNVCARFETDDTFTVNQKEMIYENMLFYDRFTSRVQEMIYFKIREAIGAVYDILGGISALDKPVYNVIDILVSGESGQKLIGPYNESDLFTRDIDYFF
jgi:hypothetical protein